MSVLAELSDVVAEELRVRKYPHKVAYGPERTKRTGPGIAPGVVFERDRDRGDPYAAPVATRQGAGTPETYYSRQVASMFTVYAQSPKPGARVRDHEAEAEAVCDAVVSAMARACKLAGKLLSPGSLRFLRGADFDLTDGREFENWPGVAARVEFFISVPVRDVDYLGRGPDTGTVSGTGNTYEAALVGESDEP